MKIKTITAPPAEPVTLTEAKTHIREDSTDEEVLNNIKNLITTAREYCEGIQNKRYITQTLEGYLDAFPLKNYIEFKNCSPVQSVTSIQYRDSIGGWNTFDSDNYELDDADFINKVFLGYGEEWPSVSLWPVNSVKITFIAGYAPSGEGENIDYAANVPQKVKQSMLLLISHWYENREAVLTGTVSKKIELAVDALLGQDRVMPV